MKFGKALLEAETQCQALTRNGTTPCGLMWVDYKFLKKHIRPIIENIADRKEGSNMSIRITLNSIYFVEDSEQERTFFIHLRQSVENIESCYTQLLQYYISQYTILLQNIPSQVYYLIN